MASERTGERAVSILLDGGETCSALLCIVRVEKEVLPRFIVQTAGGDRLRPIRQTKDRIDFQVAAKGRLVISWS
jgi:hypothetical protein